MVVALYIFCLPWIYSTIVDRYWVEKDYDAVLVGLDDTTARAYFMVAHMSLGAVCLLCGPTQFLVVIRQKWPTFHRWSGRLYVVSAVLCSICGSIFIFLKGFILVGGLNMGLAFFVAGIVFGGFAVQTAVHARNRAFTQHRNWAIRSYGQILAPMLYRYFYLIVGGLGLYPADTELDCNENDVCRPFTNTFDSIHAWTYFLFPMICTEFIIRALPPKERVRDNNVKETPVPQTQDKLEEDQEENVGDAVIPDNEERESMENKQDLESPQKCDDSAVSDQFNYGRINLLGMVGAVLCVGFTLLIYVTSFLGTNTVST